MIRKIGSRKFGLYSLKSHKRLGVFSSRTAATAREKQISFFKYKTAHPEQFSQRFSQKINQTNKLKGGKR